MSWHVNIVKRGWWVLKQVCMSYQKKQKKKRVASFLVCGSIERPQRATCLPVLSFTFSPLPVRLLRFAGTAH